jgi:hypothetical protein
LPAYPGLTGVRPALVRLAPDRLMVEGLNRVPFVAVPIWHISRGGTPMSSDGVAPILIETDTHGDTLRGLQLPRARIRPVPVRERADSLRALEERIARLPVPLGQVEGVGEGVQARRLPDVLPMAIGLEVRDDGSVWLERWPMAAAYHAWQQPRRGIDRRRSLPARGERRVSAIARDLCTRTEPAEGPALNRPDAAVPSGRRGRASSADV